MANIAGSGGGGGKPKKGRTAHIDKLITASFTATPQDAQRLVAQFKALNLSPAELKYVSTQSGRRGDAAIRAKAKADLHDLTHTVLPRLANAPLGLIGTNTHLIKYAASHPIARIEEKGPFTRPKGTLATDIALPFGFGKAIKGLTALGKKSVSRGADEAAQHVAQAAKAAKDKGFGAAPPLPPQVIAPTPATAGELGVTVRNALKGAEIARGKQQAVRSVELGKRAGKAASAIENIGGLEGHIAAKQALKGELPKVQFAGFQNLDGDAILAMMKHAQTHPDLQTFEKINTVDAITKAANGVVPTASEQALLHRAFGVDVANSVVKAATWRDHLGRNLSEVVNLPRAIASSFDLSAPFRQGLVAGISHPVIFSRNLLPMIKAFGSDRVYTELMNEIRARPTFPLMDKAGLAITDVHSHDLVGLEEAYMSRLVGKIPGLRGSSRAYTGFLNKTRADIFDHLIQEAAQVGVDLHNAKQVKDIARFVNTATGRGDLGKLAPAAVALNSTLFSPRLLASRLNLISPRYYYTLSPFARKEALKAAAGLIITMGTVLEIARQAGATVNSDPTNADFGKIRIGNTRIDIAAGFQQPIRAISQIASGRVTSSTTGKTLTLGASGPGKLSRWDILERFAISKLAPVPSIGSDLLHGSNFIGQPVTLKSEVSSHLLPLLWQDIYDLYKNGGIGAAAGGVIPGLFGVGLQTYKAKTKSSGGNPFDSPSGSSGNPFDGGSTPSSTNPFDKP